MYKPRAYKRHITVVEFLPKDNFRFYFVLFLCRPNTGRSPFEEKKPIFCTSTIGFHWKMQVREAGLVRLSFVSTTGKPCEIRSAVRVFYCDLFEI